MLAGYLYLIHKLTNEALILFVIALVSFFLFFQENKKYITYDEARKIAVMKIEELQRKGEIPDGTIWLTAETGRKNVIIPTDKGLVWQPKKWIVGLVVEGTPNRGYFVDIDPFGDILETSENDDITSWRVYHVEDDRRLSGYMPTTEESEADIYSREVSAKKDKDRTRRRERGY